MAPRAESRKVANSLVALSSSAILVVYAAGFLKTRAASAMLDEASNGRRPSMPSPSTAGETPTAVTRDVASASAASASTTATHLISPSTPGTEPVAGAPRTTAASATPSSAASAETSSIPTPGTTANAPAGIVAAPLTLQAPEPVATTVETTLQATPAASSAPVEEKKVAALLMPKEQYKDGSYLGWGTSRHGDIQASVTIANGRITDASIAQCRTRYSCNVIEHLPPQVMERQSPDVDYVSGATQSANAFYFAVVEALAHAK